MTNPQVNAEDIIQILRVRLNEEIYQRALLEVAYTQAAQHIKTLTGQLAGAERKLAETQAEHEHDSSLGLRGNPITPVSPQPPTTPVSKPPEIPWQQLSRLQTEEKPQDKTSDL